MLFGTSGCSSSFLLLVLVILCVVQVHMVQEYKTGPPKV